MPKWKEEKLLYEAQTKAGYITDEPPNGGLDINRLIFQHVYVKASTKKAESKKKKSSKDLKCNRPFK